MNAERHAHSARAIPRIRLFLRRFARRGVVRAELSGRASRAVAGGARSGVAASLGRLMVSILGAFIEPSAAAVLVAQGGKPVASIVLPGAPDSQEETAAAELSTYLGRISGASFETLSEDGFANPTHGIYVGRTRFAARYGIDLAEFGPEEWTLKTVPGGLIVAGGRPRGTLYAVYHLLEDHFGVRWWNPFEEFVPRRSRLSLRHVSRRSRPTFSYRDVHGVHGPRAFWARNRINGHFTSLPMRYGGTVRYGPPQQVHNFYVYVSPDEHFQNHPEWFSLIDGLRVGEKGQLCLANHELRRVVLDRLRGYIEQDRIQAEARGEPPARLFALSQNDWGGACQCDSCRAVAESEGTEAGPMIAFVNWIADSIHKDYPDIQIDTLAYHYSFRPPNGIHPRDNVVVRLSGLQLRDFSRSVLHPRNQLYRQAVEGWAAITKHLRIWDYSVTFGVHGDLPLPNLAHFATDYRFYRDAGVEGVFVQHEHPLSGDLRDLKLWVIAKLLEDPSLEPSGLVRDFTDGYYGPGGRLVRRYLILLAERATTSQADIRFVADPEDYSYLDLPFLRAAHAIFERAAARVSTDPDLARRIRHARLSLDRATLLRWRDLQSQWLSKGRGLGNRGFRLRLDTIARRYLRTWSEQAELRRPPRWKDRIRESEAEVVRLLEAAVVPGK